MAVSISSWSPIVWSFIIWMKFACIFAWSLLINYWLHVPLSDRDFSPLICLHLMWEKTTLWILHLDLQFCQIVNNAVIYIQCFSFHFQRGNLKKALNYSQKMVELGMCLWFSCKPNGFVLSSLNTQGEGEGVLPYKRLMGMCCWMGSHFHDWIDYNGVAFSIELLEWGRTFSDFWG